MAAAGGQPFHGLLCADLSPPRPHPANDAQLRGAVQRGAHVPASAVQLPARPLHPLWQHPVCGTAAPARQRGPLAADLPQLPGGHGCPCGRFVLPAWQAVPLHALPFASHPPRAERRGRSLGRRQRHRQPVPPRARRHPAQRRPLRRPLVSGPATDLRRRPARRGRASAAAAAGARSARACTALARAGLRCRQPPLACAHTHKRWSAALCAALGGTQAQHRGRCGDAHSRPRDQADHQEVGGGARRPRLLQLLISRQPGMRPHGARCVAQWRTAGPPLDRHGGSASLGLRCQRPTQCAA